MAEFNVLKELARMVKPKKTAGAQLGASIAPFREPITEKIKIV